MKAVGRIRLVSTSSRSLLPMISGQLQSKRDSEVPLPYLSSLVNTAEPLLIQASDEIKDLAQIWIAKLSVKNGTYPPDSYPNPGMTFLQNKNEADNTIPSTGLPQCSITSKCVPGRV